MASLVFGCHSMQGTKRRSGTPATEGRMPRAGSVSKHLHLCRWSDLVFGELAPELDDVLADTMVVATGLDLTDDAFGARLDVLGNHERSPDEAFDTHQREPEGLLCTDRDADLIDHGDASFWELFPEVIDNVRVWGESGHGSVPVSRLRRKPQTAKLTVRAATTHVDLVELSFLGAVALVVLDKRLGRDASNSRHTIFRRRSLCATPTPR
jgi:hypothetical protein